MANTGQKWYPTLEQYYVATGLPTGVTKPNLSNDYDYIPPLTDSFNCAVGETVYIYRHGDILFSADNYASICEFTSTTLVTFMASTQQITSGTKMKSSVNLVGFISLNNGWAQIVADTAKGAGYYQIGVINVSCAACHSFTVHNPSYTTAITFSYVNCATGESEFANLGKSTSTNVFSLSTPSSADEITVTDNGADGGIIL